MTAIQILAATFTIVFEGLMVFVGPSQNSKMHVAIVNDPVAHGNPTLYINNVRTEGLLKEDALTFSKLAAGPATTDTSFDARIPTLSDFIGGGGDLHTDVKEATHPHNSVLAFLLLPAGDLSAEGKFDHPASFTKKDGSTEMRCPAPNVRLKITTTETDFVLTISNPNRKDGKLEIPLKSTDIIGISNSSSVVGNHFHKYRDLMTKTSTLGPVNDIPGKKCKMDGSIENSPALLPKWSSSLSAAEIFRVFRAPAGDCGPVDFP